MMKALISLRPLLWFDAATCVTMGALLAAAASPLSSLLGLPSVLLQSCAVLLVVFAGFVAFIATRGNPAGGTKLIAAANIAWVVASFVLLAGPWLTPTLLGTAFIAVQALAVAAIAALELAAVRAVPASA